MVHPALGPNDREPDLITHHTHNGTGPDDFDYDKPYSGEQAAFDEFAPGGQDADGKPVLSPAQRKKRRWRRIRRTLYVLVGVFVVVPAIAFVITYFLVDVPSPKDVAQTQGQAVTFLYSDGSEMGKDIPKGQNRQILQPDQIAEVMKQAAIATEDASFETNSGFDVTGILRAGYNQLTGGTGGGSTISQQYIKKATDNDDPTLTRKWTELAKSFKMNQTFEKKDIITAYLNIIYFGRGAYGVGAASQAFFAKDASQLNASEAALLAGLIQQPGRSENPKVAHDRWNTALDRMVTNKYLSAADRAAAQFPAPIPLEDAKQQAGTVNPFIKAQIKDELSAQGITEDKYYSGGYKVKTTIDPQAQQAAERAISEGMQGFKDPKLLNALVAVDPKTGGVLAYYGGEPLVKGPNGEDQAGRDWANTSRNPGSSMKAFDLTAFLKLGKGLTSTFDGSNNRKFGDRVVRNAGPGSSCSQQCTVAEAMERSANTVFYDMVLNVTKQGPVAEAAKEAGVKAAPDGNSTLFTGDNNISLGGGKTAITPVDMASAYATFAADGVQRDRHFVALVTNAQNETAYEPKGDSKSVFANDTDQSKQIAGNVTAALKPVIPFSHLQCPSGHECAGKTGTQQHEPKPDDAAWARNANSQTWMVGYTPSVSASVWVGGDLDEALYGKTSTSPIYGSTIAGPIWAKFMALYLKGKPPEQFSQVRPIGGDVAPPPSAPDTTDEQQPSGDVTTTETAPDTNTRESTDSTDPSRPDFPTRPTKPSKTKPPDTSEIPQPPDIPGG
ncbi:transglycosylase domain-containing protein [Amycolatopsis sp. H20-H5]|uniref:transglycosylase domain-containing protein n=1 Tax=Amycolatopsis sp. H20-H5 TaxID=3046309 RepID=UPI003FA3617C